MKLADRVNKIQPSPTLAIDAKAKALKAQGVDIIGFGAGEPDFDTPANIKEAAKKAIDAGFTKYTAVGGTDELKDAIIAKLKMTMDWFTPGAKFRCMRRQALPLQYIPALVQEGDEVIIPSPYWVSYPDQVILAGGKPVLSNRRDQCIQDHTGAVGKSHHKKHSRFDPQFPLQPHRHNLQQRGTEAPR